MIENDAFLRMQGQIAAIEFVQKFTLNVLSQIHPNSGMQEAMLKMAGHSIKAAHADIADPKDAEQMRAYVEKYAKQIITAGFNSKPA